MSDIKIYYMRDNHTFRPLSLTVEDAIKEVREEWDAGFTHGMLCSKSPGVPQPVHAHGNWLAFEASIRRFYAGVQQ